MANLISAVRRNNKKGTGKRTKLAQERDHTLTKTINGIKRETYEMFKHMDSEGSDMTRIKQGTINKSTSQLCPAAGWHGIEMS